jgi:hypothetical protein
MHNHGDFQRFIQTAYARENILGPAWAKGNQKFARIFVGFALKAV